MVPRRIFNMERNLSIPKMVLYIGKNVFFRGLVIHNRKKWFV